MGEVGRVGVCSCSSVELDKSDQANVCPNSVTLVELCTLAWSLGFLAAMSPPLFEDVEVARQFVCSLTLNCTRKCLTGNALIIKRCKRQRVATVTLTWKLPCYIPALHL